MTQNEFLAFYPQFSGFNPAVVLTDAIARANARFSDWDPADAEHARRLYTAHQLTLYAFTAPPSGSSAPVSMEQIAAMGKAQSSQQIASKRVGEVQVTYSSRSNLSSSASSDLADLNETAYGLQLLTLLRLYSRSRYVP